MLIEKEFYVKIKIFIKYLRGNSSRK